MLKYYLYLAAVIAVSVTGGILTDIALRYREVECTSYINGSVMIYEHTTSTSYKVSLTYDVSKKQVLPTTCWSDGDHAMLYNPKLALLMFGCIVGTLTLLTIIVHLKYVQCKYHYEKNDYIVVVIVMLMILLVSGAVIGDRYNKFLKGTCTKFVVSNGYTGNNWKTQYIGPISNGYVCYPSECGIRIEGVFGIEYSSPIPYNGGYCWTDGDKVTFNDPEWVMIWFFVSWIGLVILCGIIIKLTKESSS